MIVNNALAVSSDAADLGGAFSPERLAYAGKMTLLGMMMVFAVLAILWGILILFKVVFAAKDTAPKKSAKEKPVESVPLVEEAPDVAEQTDDELVAILTAAVAAYIESEGQSESYAGGFRVVSFRRTGGGRSWNAK
jgi:sodium pump decarboxylase gamma subunit